MAPRRAASQWRSRTISSCPSGGSAPARASRTWCRSRPASTSTRCSKPHGDRVTDRGRDEAHMATALALAERGRGRTSPNPLVGAVIVDDSGVVVGTGFHERAGEAHAEVHALRAAGARARGATLYCSLEPCSHTGRTGPCAVAVAEAGIRRVVAAMQDPYHEVAGRGFAYLRSRGVEVVAGVREAEAQQLNEVFVTNVRHRRPFVVAKIAMSLDGAIAAAPGVRTALSGEASQ